jgi:hypothetical protein
MSQGELESLLQTLRTESRGAEAPARVEEALRHAFRARIRTRRRWLQAGLAAAATLVLAAGSAAWWISRPVAPLPLVRLQHPAAPAIQAAAQSAPNRARRVWPGPRQQEEVTTEFLPLDEAAGLPPIESAQVVRVQVPQGTLVRFGVPVNQDRMLEPIQADVVFAQDGIARAIRFVNYKGDR